MTSRLVAPKQSGAAQERNDAAREASAGFSRANTRRPAQLPRAVQGPYTGSKATRALWRAPAQGQTAAAVGAARERKLRRKRRRLHDLVFLHHDQPLGLLLES